MRTGEVKLLVLLTKADKLSKREAQASMDDAGTVLGEFSTEESDIGVTLFSSLRRLGVEDAAEQLLAWRKAMPERVHFELPPPVDGEGADDVGDVGDEDGAA